MQSIGNSARKSFLDQAVSCEALGSPFTGRLCRLLSTNLDGNSLVGRQVFNWPGDYTARADNVALRLCGAVNHLALTGADRHLQAVYPPRPNFGFLDDAAVWEIVSGAIERCSSEIVEFLKTAPQTNEIRRSAALVPAWHAVFRKFALPLDIYELGASAGLNLYADQYGIISDGFSVNRDAATLLMPQWRGEIPCLGNLEIASRNACDLNPVDISNKANRTRMLAYIWPDQADRVLRTRQAMELAAQNPAHRVVAADAIDWLENKLRRRKEGTVSLFQHTIAWQYFPKSQQEKGEALFAEHGARATRANPVARFSMESDGSGVEAGAKLTLTLWPEGKVEDIGRADFHGRWVKWKNLP